MEQNTQRLVQQNLHLANKDIEGNHFLNKRMYARIIDMVVVGIAASLIVSLNEYTNSPGDWYYLQNEQMTSRILASLFLAYFIYLPVTDYFGKSIGRKDQKIKLVNAKTMKRPLFVFILLRHVFVFILGLLIAQVIDILADIPFYIDIWIIAIGSGVVAIPPVINKKYPCIHDYIFRTRVVAATDNKVTKERL